MSWKVKTSQYILERPWITLREDHVVLPSGVEMEEFHVIEYPNWAATVCIDTEGDLILVEQYRHGIGRFSLELPAGVIEKNEDPFQGAQRELLEETGYTSSEWVSLGRFSTDPSNHSNYAHFYVALNASFYKEPSYDAEEDLVTRKIPLEEALELVEKGTIIHGLHVTALMLAWQKGYLTPVPG